MNIQRYKPGQWRLTWELGRDAATGKRRRETRVVTGTRAEAARIWRERQAELDALDQAQRDPLVRSLADLLAAWLADIASRRRPSTVESYTYVSRRFLEPTLGSVALRDLTPERVTQALDAWRDGPRADRRPGAVGPRTIHAAFRTLRACLSWGVRHGWLTTNPLQAVTAPPLPPRDAQWWDAETARRFLERTADEWYWGVWALALLTGMRLGEILGLRWQDVDRAAGVVHIRQVRGRHARVTFGPPKTHRSLRPVALDAATLAVLDRQARIQAAQRERLGADWVESGLVVTTPFGTPASHRNVNRAREAAQKRAGVPLLSFKDMRHTHATLLRQQGVDWRVIADRLGHTEVSFTAQTYMHSDLREQREASAKVAARVLPEMGHTNGHTPPTDVCP